LLSDRERHGLALKDFDIRRSRDRLNVFKVLIAGAFRPRQELLDCPVVGGSRVGEGSSKRALKKKTVVAIGCQLMVDGSSNYFTVGPKRSASSFHEVMILAFMAL